MKLQNQEKCLFFKLSIARSFDKWFCWEINWNITHDNTSKLTPNGSLHSTAYNSKLDTTLNPKKVYELNNIYLSLFHRRIWMR